MSNKENWVKIFLPRAYAHEEQTMMVGINGTNYLLPRGKESLVPPEVAQEVNRAMDAQIKQDTSMDQLAKG